MKKTGALGLRWFRFRKAWMKAHPPNFEGYYICYICNKWVLPAEMELDHVLSRSRHPELRYNEDNIKPACHDCNQAKGSLDYEDYMLALKNS